MNWEEFLEAKKRLLGSSIAPPLFMQGVKFDNSTRYLEKMGGTTANNDFQSLFKTMHFGGDFVWKGTGKYKVTVHG